MGVVIRPTAFARGLVPAPLAPKPARRRINRQMVAIVLSIMALAWILALAGAAFALRAVIVLCFATLAGRARRVGAPQPSSRSH